MTEVSEKFYAKKDKEGWNAERAAKELKVSPASFYNYLNKTDLPNFEVLKRAHDLWKMNFRYIDFGNRTGTTAPSEVETPRQYLLPFIEGVRESDIEIVRAKPVQPDSLEVTFKIKFVS